MHPRHRLYYLLSLHLFGWFFDGVELSKIEIDASRAIALVIVVGSWCDNAFDHGVK